MGFWLYLFGHWLQAWDPQNGVLMTCKSLVKFLGLVWFIKWRLCNISLYPTLTLAYRTLFCPYSDTPHSLRVDTILSWLNGSSAPGVYPDFLTLYFNSIDAAGHDGGANSLWVSHTRGIQWCQKCSMLLVLGSKLAALCAVPMGQGISF